MSGAVALQDPCKHVFGSCSAHVTKSKAGWLCSCRLERFQNVSLSSKLRSWNYLFAFTWEREKEGVGDKLSLYFFLLKNPSRTESRCRTIYITNLQNYYCAVNVIHSISFSKSKIRILMWWIQLMVNIEFRIFLEKLMMQHFVRWERL